MNDCELIKYLYDKVKQGEKIENIIPMTMRDFSKECYVEILSMIIKYGTDVEKIELAKNKLKEVDNETR